MWPSEEVASRLYDWANFGLIVGLVVGIVSTVLLVWMGNAKESYLRTHIAGAGKAAAQANERSKVLEGDNLNLRLELDKSIQHQYPRQLTAEFAEELAGRPKAAADIWYSPEDTEAFILASQIYDSLGLGTKDRPGIGWAVSQPQPIPVGAGLARLSNGPRAVKSGPGFGIGVISNKLSVREPPGPWLGTPLRALEFALGVGTSPKCSVTGIEMPSLPENKFIIVVGPKL
jgi:hypothetical protein